MHRQRCSCTFEASLQFEIVGYSHYVNPLNVATDDELLLFSELSFNCHSSDTIFKTNE